MYWFGEVGFDIVDVDNDLVVGRLKAVRLMVEDVVVRCIECQQ